jgi:hypothetical protein
LAELPLEITNTGDARRGLQCAARYHGKTGVQSKWQNQHTGVGINDLTDDLVIDELTGMPLLVTQHG